LKIRKFRVAPALSQHSQELWLQSSRFSFLVSNSQTGLRKAVVSLQIVLPLSGQADKCLEADDPSGQETYKAGMPIYGVIFTHFQPKIDQSNYHSQGDHMTLLSFILGD
jgi:hypothetical protein